ncbi:hypothetical protein Bca4012_081551 [Brassica carinata]
MFLMETKRQDEEVLKMYRGTEFTNHFTVPPIGLSGGLALSWKDNVKLDILYSSPNVIDTSIVFNNKTFFVSYVYGAPNREDRPQFWKLMSDLGSLRSSAWLITGDFNDLLDNDEKEGGPLRWEGSFLSFRNFVSQNGLWDLQFSGNSLSWRGTRYSHFIQSRLDRAMANIEWMELFPAGRSEYLRFEGSDHRPLLTHFDQHLRKKKGLFRYDRRLSEKPEVKSLVEKSWDKLSPESVLTKINRVRRNLVEWAKVQTAASKEWIVSNQVLLEQALGILAEGKCKRCGDLESAYHVMFSCPVARKVWDLAPAQLVPQLISCSSISDVLSQCRRMINLPPTGLTSPLYPWIMWVLWTSRNQFMFEDKSFSETDIILKAMKLAKEWQDAQPCAKAKSASLQDYLPKASSASSLPQVPVNALLCFSDAAWNGSSCDGGLGWLAKDAEGTIRFQGTSARRHVASALMAEAMALKSGLSMAVSQGYKDIICCSDSQCLVGLLTGKSSVIALKGILHDISMLSRSLNSISFKFISRLCNVEADRCAKDALFVFSSSRLGRFDSVSNV